MPSTRTWVFFYDIAFLIALLAAGATYALQPNLSAPCANNQATLCSVYGWLNPALHAMWFAVLGSIAISLKGVYDHATDAEWSGRWVLWYVGRPFSGLIVGVMTYVLLLVVNTASSPSMPALATVGFLFGTQESRFFAFLAEVAGLILKTPRSDRQGLSIDGIKPDHARAGTVVIIHGSGFDDGTTATVGGSELLSLQTHPGGTGLAGTLPSGAGTVDVTVTLSDGSAVTKRNCFTYVP